MKKHLLFVYLAIFFTSCNKVPSPKETAQEFIKSLSSSDLATASSLTSTDTKAVLDKAKKETLQTTKPEESFQLSTLGETIADKKAEVKNDIISLSLTKESDGWKVVLNEPLLNEIQNHDEMLATAKNQWDDLQKEYEGRLQVLRDYINYKKSFGTLSSNVQKLSDAVNSISLQNQWTSETWLAYVQKQKQLNRVIDDALEPSQAANTDLSVNFFVQISNASDRIKAAEKAYQTVAEKAHSPVYRPLPFEATASIK